MGYFEERKLKRLQELLVPSTASKEIAASVKTAYTKFGKRFNLKGAFEAFRSGPKTEVVKENSINCPNPDCGIVFRQPLRVLQIQKGKEIVFYSCPRCLSEIEVEDESMLPNLNEIVDNEKRASDPEQDATAEVKSGCRYHLGYLAERDLKASIPDECMMCKDLIECMRKR